jgi:hypothetical protein
MRKGLCRRLLENKLAMKGGKDHIFLRLGLLRSPYSAQKNVAYARTLNGIVPVEKNKSLY